MVTIKELRKKGKYLETFSALGDTWSVYQYLGNKYCFSHITSVFAPDDEADLYGKIVK